MPLSLSYSQSDSYINLSWGAPKDLGGYASVTYSVYMGTSRTDLALMTSGSMQRYLGIGDLVNGRTYYLAVAAENPKGISEMSDVLEAVPMTYPSAPILRNHTSGDGWIEVSWDPPSDDGGSDIWLYHVYLGENWTKPYRSISPAVRSCRIDGLENGKTYTISISCENSYGESPRTDPIEITPKKVVDESTDYTIPIIAIACLLAIAAFGGLGYYMHVRSVRRERFLAMYRARKRLERSMENPEE
jgi:hypothetical protein